MKALIAVTIIFAVLTPCLVLAETEVERAMRDRGIPTVPVEIQTSHPPTERSALGLAAVIVIVGFVVLVAVLYLFVAARIGKMAEDRGRNGFLFFVLSFIFTPLLLVLILACMKPVKESR